MALSLQAPAVHWGVGGWPLPLLCHRNNHLRKTPHEATVVQRDIQCPVAFLGLPLKAATAAELSNIKRQQSSSAAAPRRCLARYATAAVASVSSARSNVVSSSIPLTAGTHAGKLDLVTLGNMCVDIVTPLPELPPADTEFRRTLLARLTASPPHKSTWELGANCNVLVAAARLGMRAACVAHVGTDVFGRYLEHELQLERVERLQRITPSVRTPMLESTLLCFVLVDPAAHHTFCSVYDFGPWPLLDGIRALPESSLQQGTPWTEGAADASRAAVTGLLQGGALRPDLRFWRLCLGYATGSDLRPQLQRALVLRNTRALVINGFVFDELPLEAVQGASQAAIDSGAAIFFDPGPRCFTMMEGSRRDALESVLDLSEVVLMTEEEARIVTGHADPEAAARYMLQRPGARTQWAVVKMGGQGALLCRKDNPGAHRARAFKVDVIDTVGCGDSFASAVVLGYNGRHSVEATLALASAVGAATATGRGAGRNVASTAKVVALLRQAAAHGGQMHDQAAAAEALRILDASLTAQASRAP